MSSALEGILGSALGKLGGGGTEMAIVSKVAPALMGMLAGGGAAKLLAQFKAGGLGEHADSWVGTGENKPISAEHVKTALSDEQLSQFAQQAGVPKEQAASVLAEALPKAIDHVTPSGQLPEPAEVDQTLQAPAGT